MRRLSLLFAVLFVVPLLGSDSPKEYDDRTENVGIEGTWRMTEQELKGQKITDVKCVDTFRNGIYTFQWDNKRPTRWNYRIDTACKPHHLETPLPNELNKGVLMFIYQIDGDKLRMAMFIPPEMRYPRDFHDAGIVIYTYKRVK